MIDGKDWNQILQEFWDDDREVKAKFKDQLNDDITAVAQEIAKCFVAWEKLDNKVGEHQTMQAGLVGGLAFSAIDDILTSTKLLLSGKLMASGNLMRQALEGLAMSILCAHPQIIVAKSKNTSTTLAYWSRIGTDDKRVFGHRSIELLEWNTTNLGLNADSVKQIKQAKEHWNKFSHSGPFGIVARVDLQAGGNVHIGGHFDAKKLELYKAELQQKVGVCSIIPALVDNLTTRITT